MEKKESKFIFSSRNIGIEQIVKFTSYHKDILKQEIPIPKVVDFNFDYSVERIDELLYSYILLFRLDFPQVTINLNFNVDSKAYRIGIQYVTSCNLQLKDNKIGIYLEGVKSVPYTTSSKDFIFPIIVNNQTYLEEKSVSLFQNRSIDIGFENFVNGIPESTLDQLQSESSLKEHLKDYKKLSTSSDLAWYYLFDVLEKLNVLRFYYLYSHKSFKKNDLELFISDNIHDNKIQFKDSEQIITFLKNGETVFFRFSYIKLYIFSLIVNREINRAYGIDKTLNNLDSLIKQTNDIAIGLEELAKNIIEHTDSGHGVISGRAFKHDVLSNIKSENISKWIKESPDKQNFLELSVIDSGKVSISTKYLDTLIYASESEKNPSIKDELLKDIEDIKKDKFLLDLGNVFNYKNIHFLHQIKRIRAKIGLILFSKIILEDRNGLIQVCSSDLTTKNSFIHILRTYKSDIKSERFDFDKDEKRAIALGTNYNFFIPIKSSSDAYSKSKKQIDTKELKKELSPLKELFDYSGKLVPILESNIQSDHKYGKLDGLWELVNEIHSQNNIPVIYETAHKCLVNSSDWFRFLSYSFLQTDDSKENRIIIIGDDCNNSKSQEIGEKGIQDLHEELIELNSTFTRALGQANRFGFWNKNNVLFYLKREHKFIDRIKIDDKEQRVALWFSSMLCGETFHEYLAVNSNISKYSNNLYSLYQNDFNADYTPVTNNSSFFVRDKLIQFDLILNAIPNNFTLFEDSVRSLLNLEIQTISHPLKNTKSIEGNYFNRFKGYKTSNSHFKIGSKIHIEDFYYAKRLFYNSYYANRFAFIVSNYLTTSNLKGTSKNQNITLIGYSHYSELIVGNIRRLLNSIGYKNVNHDIFLENNRVLKNINSIHEKVIIIVPISSTFTTSHKILSQINKLKQKENPSQKIEPIGNDISVILVADKSSEVFGDNKNESEYFDYSLFGWGEIKERERTINVYQNIQSYFIPLKTKIHFVHNCIACFPSDKNTEKCLQTTVNDLNPNTIFGFPIVNEKVNGINLTLDNLHDGDDYFIGDKYVIKGEKHYKNFIRIGKLLKHNYEKISDYCYKHIRNILESRIKDQSIIIITPSRSANSGFVNLVNEYIFDESATIFHYSYNDDDLQNFVKFNESYFSNSIVIFVDDSLHTLNTFWSINNYLRSIPNKSLGKKRSVFDYCICLVNRLSYYDENSLANVIPKENILHITKLNLPPIVNPNNEFPYVSRLKKFNQLAEVCVLDKMKLHALDLLERVKPFNIDSSSAEPKFRINDFFNCVVYEVLLTFFSIDTKTGNYKNIDLLVDFTIKSKQVSLLDKIITEVKKNKLINEIIEVNHLSNESIDDELKNRVLTIFSKPPFSYYKDIKEFAFNNVIKILNNHSEYIKNVDFNISDYTKKPKQEVLYSKFQTLKQLFRLAVDLNTNMLFSIGIIESVDVLTKHLSLDKTIGLTTYYVGQVQQLIYNDEAKAIELVKNIVKYISTYKISLKGSSDSPIVKLLRALVLENTYIFNTYFKVLEQEESNNLKKYTFDSEIDSKIGFDSFKKYYQIEDESEEIDNKPSAYHGQTLRKESIKLMLSKFELNEDKVIVEKHIDTDLQDAFLRTIYLKTLIKNDIEIGGSSNIIGKINKILEHLCAIIDIGSTSNNCNGKAYFSIRYKDSNKESFLVKPDDISIVTEYSKNSDFTFYNSSVNDTSLLFDIYRGIKEDGNKKCKSSLEISEFNKCNEITLKEPSGETINLCNKKEYSQSFNKIYFLTIADIEINEFDNKTIQKAIKAYKKITKDNYKEEFNKPISILNNLLYQNTKEILLNKLSDLDSVKKTIDQLPTANIEYFRDENIKELESFQKGNRSSTTYITNNKAAICFYRCEKQKCDKIDRCGMLNERLDPKRLRFLFLLRRDILNFIQHHLNNDSLRAFIEMENRAKMFGNVEHSTNIYIQHMENAIKSVDNMADRLNLSQAKHLLASRIKLQKAFAYNLRIKDSYEKVFDECEINPTSILLSEHFETFSSYMTNLHKNSIKIKDVNININNHIDSNNDSYVISYEGVMEEILFEVAFNITTHSINALEANDRNINTLIIDFSLVEIDDIYFLSIRNNFALKDESEKVQKYLLHENNSHGLSIIKKYSMHLTNKMVNVSYEKSKSSQELFFTINIPLKIEQC